LQIVIAMTVTIPNLGTLGLLSSAYTATEGTWHWKYSQIGLN